MRSILRRVMVKKRLVGPSCDAIDASRMAVDNITHAEESMMRRGVLQGGLCHGSRETVPASSRLRAFLMTKGGLWFVDEWPHVVVRCKTLKATRLYSTSETFFEKRL